MNVYFKTAQNYVCCDATWATYLKAAPPQYPSINFTVVGTNRSMTPRDAYPKRKLAARCRGASQLVCARMTTRCRSWRSPRTRCPRTISHLWVTSECRSVPRIAVNRFLRGVSRRYRHFRRGTAPRIGRYRAATSSATSRCASRCGSGSPRRSRTGLPVGLRSLPLCFTHLYSP